MASILETTKQHEAAQPDCLPLYAHDRQCVWAYPYPRVHWCEDHRARLRWRVAPHPHHGRCFVLRPRGGTLFLQPENDAGTYIAPGCVATMVVP